MWSDFLWFCKHIDKVLLGKDVSNDTASEITTVFDINFYEKNFAVLPPIKELQKYIDKKKSNWSQKSDTEPAP